jgi:hypothetical protein
MNTRIGIAIVAGICMALFFGPSKERSFHDANNKELTTKILDPGASSKSFTQEPLEDLKWLWDRKEWFSTVKSTKADGLAALFEKSMTEDAWKRIAVLARGGELDPLAAIEHIVNAGRPPYELATVFESWSAVGMFPQGVAVPPSAIF